MSPTAKDLDALHRRLLETFNPFEDRIVQTPWDTPRYLDVRSIHGSISDQVLELIRRTREDAAPRFILLRGDPGTGKTHLVRRLRLELGDLGTFITIGPFGDGRRLHRHILRQVCESLDHRRSEENLRSQLQEFALNILARAAADLPVDGWIRERLERDPAFLIEVLQQHTDPVRLRTRVQERHPGVDRDVLQVLFALLDPDRMAIAARWLQGLDLSDEDLAVLRVRESAAEEDRAGEVLRSLIQLSRDSIPLVLCFDQLEFLPVVEAEPGFVALAKVVAQLAMAGRVVLVLSCLVRTWDEYREQLPGSAVDRLVQNSFVLERLSAEHVAELLASRLQVVSGPIRGPSATYPFTGEAAAELAAEPGISVRRVLERASRALEEMRRRRRIVEVRSFAVGPPPLLEAWLDEEVGRRVGDLRDGGALPVDEGLVKRGLTLALDLARRRSIALGQLTVRSVGEGPRGARYLHIVAEFEVKAQPRRAAFCLCNTENGRSFAAHSQGLVKAMQAPGRQRSSGILLRDERLLPLSSGWKRGHEHVQAIHAAGGVLLPLDRKSLAVLEGLRTLLADAASGDLSGPDRSASPQDVEGAFIRSGHLAGMPLWGRLAAALIPQPRGPAPELAATLLEAVGRHRVLPWSRLQLALPASLSPTDLEAVIAAARQVPSRILLLDPHGGDPVFALRP